MTVAGGLRARLLHDAVLYCVEGGLQALGWFAEGRSHRPLRFLPAPLAWNESVAENALVVSTRSRVVRDVELGSDLTEDSVDMSVTIYGESESLVVHLANDIRDLLRGRLLYGATNGGTLPILDFRQATPSPIGYVAIDDTHVVRLPPAPNRAYSQHWLEVEFTVRDCYYGSDGQP